MDGIDIRVGGEPVKTAGQLADELGLDPATLRRAILRAGLEPAANLDGRTALYRPEDVRNALGNRPGKGRRRAA